MVLLLLINIVYAASLEVEYNPISDVVISELENPAIFSISIKNLGQTDTFNMYSLVGVEISPREGFEIPRGDTKKINVKFTPTGSLLANEGTINFVYKIKGATTGTQEENITIKIVKLKNVFEISTGNLNPTSEKANVIFKNKESVKVENITAKFSSVFFEGEESFSINELEEKTFQFDISKENTSDLMAGPYILNVALDINGIKEDLESTIQFTAESGIVTEEKSSGSIISKYEITKTNEGNTVSSAEITIERSIFSGLFTSFSIPPVKTQTKGLSIVNIWQENLRPGDSLKVVATTNWAIPLIILIAIIAAIMIYRFYLIPGIVLDKRINAVKTKGGEFALKVSIEVTARKDVDKVDIIDRLPPVVRLYERYGTLVPDRVDEQKRKLEWNISNLGKGDSRIFSYIVFSKIGVVGKFELPPAKAVYEKDGRIRETQSNRVFFLNEPGNIKAVEDE